MPAKFSKLKIKSNMHYKKPNIILIYKTIFFLMFKKEFFLHFINHFYSNQLILITHTHWKSLEGTV